MLRVSNISIAYGKYGLPWVIEHMSWELNPGTVLAVMGPSGCGKSTLLHALAGILPYKGSISFDGKQVTPQTCSIGLIPQNYGLLPWKTVRENCLFTAGIRGLGRKAGEMLPGLCRELGIEGLLDRYPGTLSGGQAQRAALARSFLMEPELLLMDEPFSALDVAAAYGARELFLRIWKERRPTAVIVTHRVEDALYLSHQVAVMGHGGGLDFWCDNPWQGIYQPRVPGAAELAHRLMEEIIKADQT